MAVESQKTTGFPRKTLIMDDHPVVRRGLSASLAKSHDWAVCAEAGGILEALRAGGKGYLMKDGDPDKMMEAIQAAMSGEIALSGRMKEKIHLCLSRKRRISS